MKKLIRALFALILAVSLVPGVVYAGPPRPPRGGSRPNVNVNKNVNVDVDRHGPPRGGRDVDIDVDVDRHGCCFPPPPHHPVATAAAVTATAVVTSAVIGSIVYSLPPSCSTVVINGFAYQQCGTVWYQPQISAGSTTYIVVNPPR